MNKRVNQVNPNVALVLGSGGARGIAQIAAIDVLTSRGYHITSVAGSSIGALIGGLFACGTMDDYKKWILTLDYWGVFRLMDFGLNLKGLIKGEKVFKKIAPFISDVNIEDLDIDYVAVASDIVRKKPVVINRGKLLDAIRASVSIPTVLQPIEKEGSVIVDGGVVNPLPVNLVKRNPNDMLVVVDLNAHIPVSKTPVGRQQQSKLDELTNRYFHWKKTQKNKTNNFGVFDMLNESIDLTQETLSAMMLQQYKPDILVQIPRKACGTMEFHRSDEMLVLGTEAMDKALDAFEQQSIAS